MAEYKIIEVDNGYSVRSMDFDTPLIGDYRGVEVALVRFIPSRDDSRDYANEVANRLVLILSDVDWRNSVNQQRQDYCCDPF